MVRHGERTETVAANTTVNLTTLLSLEEGVGYLLELGADSFASHSLVIAYDGDPETVGGHLLLHGRPRFITQGADPWFGRFDSMISTETTVVVTEADVCGD